MSDKKVQLLTDENLKYRFYLNQNGDAVLTSYFAKQSKEITIPKCVHDENGNTYNVVKASSAILKDHSNVEILHINALLDEVPAKLCRKFKSLKEVTVADGNTKIGSRAFYQCKKLCQANLPSTIRKIGHEAFFLLSGTTDVIHADRFIIYRY